MRIVIAGSSGLIGTALRRSYLADGHDVIRLVRRAPAAPDERQWSPTAAAEDPRRAPAADERPDRSTARDLPKPTAVIDPGALAGADAVINLAGAGVGDHRWTPAYRRLLRDSRLDAARVLAAAAARADPPPRILLCASGIRYYGVDRGDAELDESAPPGSDGFLPGLTREWEAASAATAVPICHLRMGLVLSRDGGLLARLLPWFRAGLGVRLGSGREYWSHIGLSDAVRAIRFLAAATDAVGPYNLTAPRPVRGAEFARVLAAAVHRRAPLRIPTWALRLALGDMAPEVLGGLRVVPTRLTRAGFRFDHPSLEAVLRHELAD